ncbi:helix-turn-helix domain-containing protein [Wukongibacter sp. M2B1]|uniref:helix-turn-helix domain-containing protein n=1 Tax=Wukongibacter sp. M2B1 TaxID=3088895 RepID=UPI003D7A8041
MIKIKVSELLGKHKMTRKALAEKTGIRPATVSTLYDETIKRLSVDMLNELCKAFDCKIEDILEYIPDEDE